MSLFDENIDSCNRICPYCNYSYQVEAENYSEDERVEECDECHMKFVAFESFTVDHFARPDCSINGLDHKLEKRSGAYFCSVCGACKSKDLSWAE